MLKAQHSHCHRAKHKSSVDMIFAKLKLQAWHCEPISRFCNPKCSLLPEILQLRIYANSREHSSYQGVDNYNINFNGMMQTILDSVF